MKKSLLFSILLLVWGSIFAAPISQQQALQKARQFMKGKTFLSPRRVNKAAPNETTVTDDAAFYVFNDAEGKGFVIVSGDDRAEEILGYADEGRLNLDAIPENVQSWLQYYAEQIGSISDEAEYGARKAPVGNAIAPLLTCKWNQGNPYNLMCPQYQGEYCVTGCVATAMAQVMYYHKWPREATAAIPAYTTSLGISLNSLPATILKWSQMKDTYLSSETGTAVDAVAELMRYCGQAVEMDYSPSASAANVYANTMVKYFGYSNTARDVARYDYSTAEWEEMIYDELTANRPVLYCGYSSSGGHRFVCDGYDGNGLFHINWGWGGSSDGYFVLSALNPESLGIGGGTANDGYTVGQTAIVGLQPKADGETTQDYPPVYVYDTKLSAKSFTRNETSQNFQNVSLTSRLYSMDKSISVDHAWALFKDGVRLAVLGEQDYVTVPAGHTTSFKGSLSFGAGLNNGVYEICDIYRPVGLNNWQKAIGSGSDYIIATINDNSLTLHRALEVNGITVNSATLSGDQKTGRPMTLDINITNEGYSHEQTFYLWTGNNASWSYRISTYIDHGLTGNGTFYFSPTLAGSLVLKITTDTAGTNVLWSGVVEINESPRQTLSADIEFEGAKNNAISGTTIRANVTLTNTGSTDIDDKVYFAVFPNDESAAPIQQEMNIQLAVGASKVVQLEFPDLEAGKTYVLIVSYYNEAELSYAGWSTVIVGYVFVPVTLGASLTINNLEGSSIVGTSMEGKVSLTNTGTNPYNDLIQIISIYQDDGKWYYGPRCEFTTQLAVGETKEFDVQLDGLVIGKRYQIRVNYYSENALKTAYYTNYLTVKEEESGLSDGETFTATSPEGVQMTFQVISAANKTCRLGLGASAAISTETSGTVTIPEEVEGFKVVDIADCAFRCCRKIEKIIIKAASNLQPTTTRSWFYNCFNLKQIEGLELLNTSNVTDMQWMFTECYNLTSLDLSNFNTQNVTNMTEMFAACMELTSLDLSSFDTRNLIYFSDMIVDAVNLETLVLPSLMTNVYDGMASGCSSLKEVRSLVEDPSTVSFDENAFDEVVYTSARLMVPAGTVNAYANTEGWKKFTTIEEYTGTNQLGDINGNSSVDTDDALQILQYVTKKTGSASNADVNGDGVVDAQDASLILQYVAKKITW